jgi:hypothetical protein
MQSLYTQTGDDFMFEEEEDSVEERNMIGGCNHARLTQPMKMN